MDGARWGEDMAYARRYERDPVSVARDREDYDRVYAVALSATPEQRAECDKQVKEWQSRFDQNACVGGPTLHYVRVGILSEIVQPGVTDEV